jgi:HEAT repeat protein
MVLERATGWPRSLEMQHKVVVITEYLSRRMVVSMKWQQLEGEERATALQPPPPPRAATEPLAVAEVAKLLTRLQAEETYERENAARELSNARIANPAPEFMAEMIKLSTDRNQTVRQAAVTMVAKYGTREQLPLLIKALKDPANGPVRSTIAKGLGRLKDPRAAEPLAEMLSMGVTENYGFRSGRDNFWVEALVELGPGAESAVLPLFKEKNVETRILACAVLKEVGSKKTLEVLKDQTGSPSKELSEAAAEAIRAIQARADK